MKAVPNPLAKKNRIDTYIGMTFGFISKTLKLGTELQNRNDAVNEVTHKIKRLHGTKTRQTQKNVM